MGNLDSEINHFDYSLIKHPCFELLRRLTHTEYENTVRDLTGINLKLALHFSAEMAREASSKNTQRPYTA